MIVGRVVILPISRDLRWTALYCFGRVSEHGISSSIRWWWWGLWLLEAVCGVRIKPHNYSVE